jgi:hypothetical protein
MKHFLPLDKLAPAIFLFVIFAVLCITGIGMSKKSDAVAPVNISEMPPVAEMLNAVRRAHPTATKICYNKTENGINVFFIFWPELVAEEKDPEARLHGWYWLGIDNFGFKIAGNGTRFIIDYPMDKYTVIFPDVAGLTCVEQK